MENFTFYKSLDIVNYDLFYKPNLSLDEMIDIALNDPKVESFNTLGFFKDNNNLDLLVKDTWIKNDNDGIYIKKKKIVTLITGKIYCEDKKASSFFYQTIDSYDNIDKSKYPIIISTWKDTPESIIAILKEKGFHIILSDSLSFLKIKECSINYQLHLIKEGLKYINENFKNENKIIFKTRLDIKANDHNLILTYLEKYKKYEKLSTLQMIPLYQLFYTDHIFFGSDILMNKFYDIDYQDKYNNWYPERYLLEEYTRFKMPDFTTDMYNKIFNFVCFEFEKNGIELIWDRGENCHKMIEILCHNSMKLYNP